MFNCVVRREEHCKQVFLACVGSARSKWTTLGLPQLKAVCASRVYTAQAQGFSAVVLSKAGPAFRVLPRSKLLRFSDTPQGYRLGWACVLCPSQVRAAQATRCLVSALSLGGMVLLMTSPIPATRFPGCPVGAPSQVCPVSPLGS